MNDDSPKTSNLTTINIERADKSIIVGLQGLYLNRYRQPISQERVLHAFVEKGLTLEDLPPPPEDGSSN